MTSRYGAKKTWNRRVSENIFSMFREGKTGQSNLDGKSLAASAAALNTTSQGNNGFTFVHF